MPSMQITVDSQRVSELFARAPGMVTRRVHQLVEASAIDVQREMRLVANVGVTGRYRNSITYRLSPAQLKAEIGPEVNYAEPLEYGSRPHFVSVAPGTPLRQWAVAKGINPYALQKSIARKGTKPHPVVEPTYRKMKGRVEDDIAKGIGNLIEDLSNGR